MLLSLMIMTSVGTMNVSALESVNNNIYYDEKGNYDNPETENIFIGTILMQDQQLSHFHLKLDIH